MYLLYEPSIEEKNQILKGLASNPVKRPELTDKVEAILYAMEQDGTVDIRRSKPERGKENIYTFFISEWGRKFYNKGGY